VDHGYAPVTQRPHAGILVGVLASIALASPMAAATSSPVLSPSPAASPSASPVASATPADCTPAAARLPRSVDHLRLDATISAGVSAIDPDELLDALLGSLGRTRADVCVVAFRYGGATDSLAGQLLRIEGVRVTDLAERFVDALRDRLVAYGAQASPASAQDGGGSIWTLDITAGGQRSQVVATQLEDILLVTSDVAAMNRLRPLLVVGVAPSPSGVAPAPSAGMPSPSPALGSPTG